MVSVIPSALLFSLRIDIVVSEALINSRAVFLGVSVSVQKHKERTLVSLPRIKDGTVRVVFLHLAPAHNKRFIWAVFVGGNGGATPVSFHLVAFF